MKAHINLIPESFLRRRLLRRWSIRWIAIWCSAAVLVATYYLILEHEISLDNQINASIQTKAKPILEMTQAIQQYTAQLKSIESNDALLHRLSGEGAPLNSIGLVSAGAAKCKDRIWIQQLRFETRLAEQKSAPANVPRTDPPPTRLLTVAGIAADNQAVAQFVSALRETEAFQRIELKSSLNTQFQGISAWSFEIESEL